MRQHAVHAEHDIVLPILSNASTVSKRIDILTHCFDILVRHHSGFFEPHCCYEISRGPPQWGCEIHGLEIFLPDITLFLETV